MTQGPFPDPPTPTGSDATAALQTMPLLSILALGMTQIIGYGTLFYSFAILAPAIARDFEITEQWAFGALSVALFAGSLLAPLAGRLADRVGAGEIMTAGSAVAAVALAAGAIMPHAHGFALALVVMEMAACFVLYSTAFVLIVQIGPSRAAASITHITLIAGFASTVFWPFTAWLHSGLTWREVYFVFAALNLFICLPVHAALMRLGRRRRTALADLRATEIDQPRIAPFAPGHRRRIFLLMFAGFAVEGFVLAAILIHMVPLIGAVGAGTSAVAYAALFGPAQVASRLINMVFGGRLPQSVLATMSASLLAGALAVFVLAAPSPAGVIAFVVLFGLGSGLLSIIGGTLPLESFGRAGYGAFVGWMSAARQISTSFAPFAFATLMASLPVLTAAAIVSAIGVAGIAAFASIALHRRD